MLSVLAIWYGFTVASFGLQICRILPFLYRDQSRSTFSCRLSIALLMVLHITVMQSHRVAVLSCCWFAETSFCCHSPLLWFVLLLPIIVLLMVSCRAVALLLLRITIMQSHRVAVLSFCWFAEISFWPFYRWFVKPPTALVG